MIEVRNSKNAGKILEKNKIVVDHIELESVVVERVVVGPKKTSVEESYYEVDFCHLLAMSVDSH